MRHSHNSIDRAKPPSSTGPQLSPLQGIRSHLGLQVIAGLSLARAWRGETARDPTREGSGLDGGFGDGARGEILRAAPRGGSGLAGGSGDGVSRHGVAAGCCDVKHGAAWEWKSALGLSTVLPRRSLSHAVMPSVSIGSSGLDSWVLRVHGLVCFPLVVTSS
jgi:hypothetical protein